MCHPRRRSNVLRHPPAADADNFAREDENEDEDHVYSGAMQEQISLEDEVADYGYEGSDREDEDEEIGGEDECDELGRDELEYLRSGFSAA